MAFFEVTPAYTETVSVALSRGGSLFAAKNGYLKPGDMFRINNGTGYSSPLSSANQNTLGQALAHSKINATGSNPLIAATFNKSIQGGSKASVGDLYMVTSSVPDKGIFGVRNMIDGDFEGGGGFTPSPANKIVITGPLPEFQVESDDTVTVTGTLSQGAIDAGTYFTLTIRELGETQSDASSVTIASPGLSWSQTFIPEDLSYPIANVCQASITASVYTASNVLICSDTTLINIRPDGDGLVTTYGTITPQLWFGNSNGSLAIVAFSAVDNTSGSTSTSITIPTNLDGLEAGNDELLDAASIALLANGGTLGEDFGQFYLMITSSEPGIVQQGVEIGGLMNVRIGAGFNADFTGDNNDTGLSQAFQVLSTAFGSTAKMEIIGDTGTAYSLSASIDTSGNGGLGVFTLASINLGTVNGGSAIPPGHNYRIKVTSNADDDMFAFGEYFTIQPSLASLALTAPVSGADSYMGDALTVTWTSTVN
tara:strand:- start:1300 stop:2745 length:1446 start_codon:yes stop_codon:yes gene_type:complete